MKQLTFDFYDRVFFEQLFMSIDTNKVLNKYIDEIDRYNGMFLNISFFE